MSREVEVVLLVLGVLASVCGSAMGIRALTRHRSPAMPASLFVFVHPRYWRPVWTTRAWFTGPKGFRMHWIGAVMMSLGSLLIFLAIVFGP